MTQGPSQLASAPLRHPTARPAWRGWLLLWCIIAACQTILLLDNGALDTWFYCTTRWAAGEVDTGDYKWQAFHDAHAADPAPAFYMRTTPPFGSRFYNRTYRLWGVLRCFGEPWMVIILLLVIALYARRLWYTALAAGAGIFSAAGLAGLLALVAGRDRPTHADGANVWEFLRGFHDTKDLSFPSGHATVAFALAAVFTYLSPRGRILFLVVATGCATSRVVMQAHFWGDVIPGAALGWTLGWAAMAWSEKAAVYWERTHKSLS